MPAEPNSATASSRGLSVTTKVLFLLCLMYLITYIDRVIMSTAGAVFKEDLHLTNTEVGLVFSAFAYPYLVVTIFGGWIGDRFGARRTLAISAIVWGAATLLTGLVSSLVGMVLARIMLGLGEGATFPTATRALCDWLPEKRRAFAQGITHSSSRLGTSLTPPLVAWLVMLFTWRGAFIVLGVISLLWMLVWDIYFRDDPADHPGITVQELQSLPKYIPGTTTKKDPVPWLPLARRMLPVTGVYFCYGWTLWLYLAWIPSFFLHSYGLDLQRSAFFSAGVLFAGVVGDTAGGLLSDRIFTRTGDRNKARRNLVIGGFLCSLVSMLPVLFTRKLAVAAVSLSAAFFFSESTIGPMWAIPMDIAPRFSGSASGLMNIGSPLAAIISPLVFGYVIDKTGNWELPFLGSIGLLLFGSALAFWMKPSERLTWAAL